MSGASVTRGAGASSPGLVLLTVGAAQFMSPFMLTAVGVALPSMGDQLGATAMQLGLVEQLFVLSMAMGMLTFGRLGDLVGQRRVVLSGLVLFTAVTVSLGLAPNIDVVMVLRFLQGTGSSMMLGCSLAMVAAAYPKERRGSKIGIVSACTYSGLCIGPVIGGFITAQFGWRFVFLAAVPLGIIAIAVCLWGIRESVCQSAGSRLDWRGGLVFGISVLLFMEGAAHAKQIPIGPLMIALGLIGFAAFFILESHTEFPLLDVTLLTRNRFFALSLLAAMGNYAATFGITFMMSLYLQYVKGMSPREAGFLLLFQPALQLIAAPIAGRLADRMPARRLTSIGMLTSSLGLILAAITLTGDTPIWLLSIELAIIGAGFGIFIAPNSTAIMGSVREHQFGIASGMIGTVRTLGMAVSMSSITLVIALFMGEDKIEPQTVGLFLRSMRAGLVLFAIFSCLGMVVSYFRGIPPGVTARR